MRRTFGQREDKYNLVSLANAIYDTGANLAVRRLDWLALIDFLRAITANMEG